MNIGIIGSGNMGRALGKIWSNKGHKVLFSYSREPNNLRALVDSIAPSALVGTPAEAAQFGEVIFLAVPWVAVEDALSAAGSLDGKVLITCVSPLKPDFEGLTTGITAFLEISAAETIAQLVPTAKVVEAFNLTFAEILESESRQFGSEQASVFYCGDDEQAKYVTAELIKESGYEAIDAGPLKTARTLESLATIWVQMAVVTGMFPNVALKVLRR
ncbi:NADPH-dependent F420 reductase [Nostoc sp. WHI]|uniref:NADPH-dependent F420 reductase n=1 Tax=Nostoc sp. WHI TaxID=2650611 RepID=UPI0018C76755|nr:NADPH-dependent F420 reductase [Nostoc sp. WHI]MBG1270932.1 NADPH-dependent F420 reductase [Nostoc sp. WHI]